MGVFYGASFLDTTGFFEDPNAARHFSSFQFANAPSSNEPPPALVQNHGNAEARESSSVVFAARSYSRLSILVALGLLQQLIRELAEIGHFEPNHVGRR